MDRPPSIFSTSPRQPHSPPPRSPVRRQFAHQNLTDSHDGGAPLSSEALPPPEPQPSPIPTDSITGPPFAPLFTVVNNASTRTTHHPRVHYIFSDDEPDVLDDAIARHHAHAQARARADGEADSTAPLDRAIVLDLVPSADGSGWEVGWASSLSPDWAVLKSRLSRAEEGGPRRAPKARRQDDDAQDASTIQDDSTNDDEDAGHTLMLEIEGVECDKPAPFPLRPLTGERSSSRGGTGSGASGELGWSSTSKAAAARNHEDTHALADEFRRRMGLVKKVVHADEERKAAVEREAERAAEEQRAAEAEIEANLGIAEGYPEGQYGEGQFGSIEGVERGQ